MADPELREAMVAEEIRNKADRTASMQPGVGGPLEELVVQGVARKPDLQKYVGRSLGRHRPGRGQALRST